MPPPPRLGVCVFLCVWVVCMCGARADDVTRGLTRLTPEQSAEQEKMKQELEIKRAEKRKEMEMHWNDFIQSRGICLFLFHPFSSKKKKHVFQFLRELLLREAY